MKGDQINNLSTDTGLEDSSFSKSGFVRKRVSSRNEDEDWIVDTPKRRPPRPTSETPDKNEELIVEVETPTTSTEQTPSKEETNVEVKKSLSNRQIAAIKREQKKKIELKRQVCISF